MTKLIQRSLEPSLKETATWFPVVSLSGPRQSGKSTLSREAFPDYEYVNLEDPQIRRAAIEDPVSFIRNRASKLIIDEAQYAPDLFSMIQVVSDERGEPGQYVLTGSQNFLMMKSIGQSLAGRVGLLTLLPLSFRELQNENEQAIDVDKFTLVGGYPRLHDANIPPSAYFRGYVQTYVERDVAELLDVRGKTAFHKLLTICAQNTGGLFNAASLARDTGVSVPTIRNWLSILETSYLIFSLQPYHANTKKRLTKTPKLYFYDTGLLCYLLNITTVSQLVESPFFGAVFENLIIAETLKRHLNANENPELYFYRDDTKREIDLLDFTDPQNKQAIEIKSSRTYHDKYTRHLNTVCNEIGIEPKDRYVVARVESSFETNTCKVTSARDWLMKR
ncbi:ATP-binding protein [Anaerotardibacter muris]|uniref:ATP-binding protein n=1 Tax=Anaerotardibacter muris TaxID=2941505 RepID=UPI0020400685|nr:ATP-binding protein [Anaerotardibacter muris]